MRFLNVTESLSTNAMFGIEAPEGRTPFQGGSLYITSPGLKRPTSQSGSTELAEVLRRGWLFGVTYHNMRGAIASATAAWAILLDRSAVMGKRPNSRDRSAVMGQSPNTRNGRTASV